MIQDPNKDGETAAGYGGPIRTWFEAFRNLKQAPTADSLKKPTGGDERVAGGVHERGQPHGAGDQPES
jgi:hypothetical protein